LPEHLYNPKSPEDPSSACVTIKNRCSALLLVRAVLVLRQKLKALALVKLQGRFKVKRQSEPFPERVQEVYAISQDSSSRCSTVAQVVADYRKELQGEQTFLDLLHEARDFVADLTTALRLIW
jgi:hypothetical protein